MDAAALLDHRHRVLDDLQLVVGCGLLFICLVELFHFGHENVLKLLQLLAIFASLGCFAPLVLQMFDLRLQPLQEPRLVYALSLHFDKLK